MVAQATEPNVHEIVREIERRFGDFVAEEWARRSPNLGPKREFVTVVRELYRAQHNDEAEESFDALLESMARAVFERKLRQGRSNAMQMRVLVPYPSARVAPTVQADTDVMAAMASLTMPDPDYVPFTPPPAQGSKILADLSRKLGTKIVSAVDEWMETIDGEPINVRFLSKSHGQKLIADDTTRITGADVHREVIYELTKHLTGEERIGDRYTDEEIMALKTKRADEVRLKHEMLGAERHNDGR